MFGSLARAVLSFEDGPLWLRPEEEAGTESLQGRREGRANRAERLSQALL